MSDHVEGHTEWETKFALTVCYGKERGDPTIDSSILREAVETALDAEGYAIRGEGVKVEMLSEVARNR